MSMIFDTRCITSKIKNISGHARAFTFLPGAPYLASDEERTYDGDIFNIVGSLPGSAGRRKLASLKLALHNGDLIIVGNPNPIIENDEGDPKILQVIGASTLAITDPTFSESDSEG